MVTLHQATKSVATAASKKNCEADKSGLGLRTSCVAGGEDFVSRTADTAPCRDINPDFGASLLWTLSSLLNGKLISAHTNNEINSGKNHEICMWFKFSLRTID